MMTDARPPRFVKRLDATGPGERDFRRQEPGDGLDARGASRGSRVRWPQRPVPRRGVGKRPSRHFAASRTSGGKVFPDI